MKYFDRLILFAISCIIMGCSTNSEEWENLPSNKHILPFKIKIADETNDVTRAYFHGADTYASNAYRNIYWNEGDEIMVHAADFTTTQKAYTYKIHITKKDGNNASEVVLYGDDELPWWQSGNKNARFLYPASKYKTPSSTTSNDLEVTIDPIQNGSIDMVEGLDKIYAPSGQSGQYTSYNVADYSNLIIIATADNLPTTNYKPNNATLNFFVCVKALDVILDAPTSGSMKVLSTKIEIGAGADKNTFGNQCVLTGTIKPRSTNGSLSSNQIVIDRDVADSPNVSKFVKVNFAMPVTLSGKDRIVARHFIPREVGNYGSSKNEIRGGIAKITVEIENETGTKKTFVKYITIQNTSSNNQTITHFYLGPVPTF